MEIGLNLLELLQKEKWSSCLRHDIYLAVIVKCTDAYLHMTRCFFSLWLIASFKDFCLLLTDYLILCVDFSSRLRWKVSWVSWQQKSSHVFLAWRRNAKLSHWSWKSGRNRLRKKLQNFWVKAFTAISFWLLSVATSGPTKITLTTPIKAYLQRFIYSCLQKRSFILGSNTATKQQKLCTQCTSLAHS